MKNLTEGQFIYKICDIPERMFKYTVIGVIKSEVNQRYVVRCETCDHGYQCELIIKYDKDKNLCFDKMIEAYDSDEHECWHTTHHRYYFYTTRHVALIEHYKYCVDVEIKEINSLKENLMRSEKELEKFKTLIAESKENIKNEKPN